MTEFILAILKCSIRTNTYNTDGREKLSLFTVLKNGIRNPGLVHNWSQRSEITKCNYSWIYLSLQILCRYKQKCRANDLIITIIIIVIIIIIMALSSSSSAIRFLDVVLMTLHSRTRYYFSPPIFFQMRRAFYSSVTWISLINLVNSLPKYLKMKTCLSHGLLAGYFEGTIYRCCWIQSKKHPTQWFHVTGTLAT